MYALTNSLICKRNPLKAKVEIHVGAVGHHHEVVIMVREVRIPMTVIIVTADLVVVVIVHTALHPTVTGTRVDLILGQGHTQGQAIQDHIHALGPGGEHDTQDLLATQITVGQGHILQAGQGPDQEDGQEGDIILIQEAGVDHIVVIPVDLGVGVTLTEAQGHGQEGGKNLSQIHGHCLLQR